MTPVLQVKILACLHRLSVIVCQDNRLGKFQNVKRLIQPTLADAFQSAFMAHNQPTKTKTTEGPFEGLQSPMAIVAEEEVRNGNVKFATEEEVPDGDVEGQNKKRKRRSKSEKGAKINGENSKRKRRHSVSKPARDPRDQASPIASELGVGTRSPSPVIDFDGLSRPSMSSP